MRESLKSYKFESYVFIAARTEAEAREKLGAVFEYSGPEWELTETWPTATPPRK